MPTRWIGVTADGQLDIEAELTETEKGLTLSISGSTNNCGGQINLDLKPDDVRPQNGWTKEDIKKLFDIWNKWHLNDMRAGCVHQTEANWKSCLGHWDDTKMERCGSDPKPLTKEAIKNANDSLKRNRVALIHNPGIHYYCEKDRVGKPCPICGYNYGSAWLFEQLPQDVIDWIKEKFYNEEKGE